MVVEAERFSCSTTMAARQAYSMQRKSKEGIKKKCVANVDFSGAETESVRPWYWFLRRLWRARARTTEVMVRMRATADTMTSSEKIALMDEVVDVRDGILLGLLLSCREKAQD